MLMHKPHRRRQTQPWDLFHQPPQTPTWEELPPPVQHQVTELLAELLREHGEQKAPNAGVKENGHE
jgi:hypothetical protein